jgi:cytochrome c peroxidase
MTNPVEMGLYDSSQLVKRVQANPHYASSFERIFGEVQPSVSEDHIAGVLAAFIRSMPITESAYDRYVSRGNAAPLDSRAKLGLDLFSGKAHCAECHSLRGSPAALTDNHYHRGGVGMDSIQQDLATLTTSVIGRSLRGTDVGTRVSTHADEAQLGRFNVTLDPADIGLFRTPSLRDVSKTAPYMHDGSVPTLDEAIDREVYYRGLQDGRPLNLSVEDRRDLKAFLESL